MYLFLSFEYTIIISEIESKIYFGGPGGFPPFPEPDFLETVL